MTSFPDSALIELTAEAAFGADLTADPGTWSWTELTCASPSNPTQTISRILDDSAITISRGVAVGGSQQQTTSASVSLLNLDGALTPQLVTSPYWPYVDAGTPFRLRMRTDTSTLFGDTFTRTTSPGWGTPDVGAAWTYGSGTTASFSVTGGTGRISITGTNVNRRAVTTTDLFRDLDVVVDLSVPAVATGAAHAVGVFARYQDSSNHLWATAYFTTAAVVQLNLWQVVAGVSTLLGTYTSTVAYGAGTLVRLRTQVVGDRVRMKTWLAAGSEPGDFQMDVRQTAYTGSGKTGVQAWVQTGNTNANPVVFTVDNFTVTQPPYDRVEGYIADIRPVFLPQADGTTWSTVIVDIAGVGSRLEKQQSPAYSPLRRSIQLAELPPVAYWPLEDDEGSTFGASAFPGGPSMLVNGPAVFAFSQGTPIEQYLSRYGSRPLVSVAAGARLSAVVPVATVTSQWAVTVVGDFCAPLVGGGLTEMRIAEWQTPSGTYNRWALVAISPNGYEVRAYQDSTSTVTALATYTTQTFIAQTTYTVEASQSGSDIFVQTYANDNLLASGTLVSATQAPVTKLVLNPDRTNTTNSTSPLGIRFVVGHARVVDDVLVHDTPYYGVSETGVTVSAIYAWYLEPAHRRLARLCDEGRVPFDFLGDPATTGFTLLNAQQNGGFTDLTAAAAEAESGGLLYESRYGYKYLPRTARYNQAAALTIDLSTYNYSDDTDPAAVLVPQLDTRAANYWTISRTNGSSQSYAADAAYRLRRGTIAEERTLDVLKDDVLLDHAGWRTHLSVDGTGANYPSVLLDLAANPAYVDAWLACDIGSRVQRTNQPSIAGSGTIDQVIEGIVETITPTSWQVVMAASPGSVWDVAVWDDPGTVWAPSLTTLSAPGLTTTALSFTMAGEAWVTGAVSLLFEIDGEQMTVSNISGSGTGPYTVTVSARSVNGLVRAHTAGASVTLANPARWAL